MHKQEYVHVHALLVEVSLYLVDQEDMPAEVLSEYATLDTRPSNVNESKEKHHEAVTVLATAIGTWLEGATDDRADLTVR